jgi:phosphoribosylformylglycinamidine synthase
MSAYEIMLSESQERMLMVLKPGREEIAKAIFDKWELDFAIVGVLTDTKHMVLKRHGVVVADLPIDPLALASPEYDRPWVEPKLAAPIDDKAVKALPPLEALSKLLNTPDLCSKRWIYRQYDHMVMGDTIGRPGGDAGIVRVHGTERALAITTDCTPRYCQANPYEGGKQAVAEAWRNLTAVGARPLAVTDNLNFGNPEKPEIMGQIVKAIQGMGEACLALDFPVVSGNVSLYNETNGQAILPTPAIGAVGVIDQLDQCGWLAFEQAGEAVLLIGETKGHLGASIYAREIAGTEAGQAPVVDLAAERKNGDFVRGLIHSGRVTACHDVSGGGLLVTVAEMAMAGGMGVTLADAPADIPAHAFWFGEDQARYVVAANSAEAAAILTEAAAAGIKAMMIGTTGGRDIRLGAASLSLVEVIEAHESWLPNFMSGPDSN